MGSGAELRSGVSGLPDINEIRRGLAANLAALKPPLVQVSPYLLSSPQTPCAMVSGIDVDGLEYTGFGFSSIRATFLIDVAVGLVADIKAQELLDQLMGTGDLSLVAAVQADTRLTKRYLSDGRITEDNDPAADDLGLEGFRGQQIIAFANQQDVLVATFAFTVYAS